MRKVIRGKMYDTNTAEKLCEYKVSKFHSIYETIYRKTNGEFFKLVENFVDNFFGITPLSIDEAKEIIEVRFDGDEYEEIFGKVEE